jgi:integrase/recombinase XerD
MILTGCLLSPKTRKNITTCRHVSIQTTEVYARADSKQKRIALEKVYVNVNPGIDASWETSESLLTWLKQF